MSSKPRRATCWPFVALAVVLAAAALLLAASLTPRSAIAQQDIPVGGTAAVPYATSGAGLRADPSYEAPVLALLPGGTLVDVRDGPFWSADGTIWYGVAVDGTVGFLAATDLTPSQPLDGSGAAQPSSTAALDPSAANQETEPSGDAAPLAARQAADPSVAAAYTATTTTNLNLRAGPSTTDAVLLVLPPFAPLTVTGNGVNGFLPVTYNGTAGWAFAQFISATTTPIPSPSTAPQPTPTGLTALVTTTLNLRAGPSTADAVLAVMPPGSSVALTGQAANGFLSAVYNGTTGWAFADYLEQDDVPPGSNPTPTPTPAPTAAPTPAPTPAPSPGTGTGTATTTAPLNLRAGPSTADAVILTMPPGAAVTLTGNSANGFVSVTYNGTNGWAYAQYLAGGGTPSPTPAPSSAPSPAPSTPPGPTTGNATTTAPLNLRSGPSTADAIILTMPAGAGVGITGAAQNGFYPVSYNGTGGWAFGSYLSIGGAASTPNPSATPSPNPSSPPGTAPPAGGSLLAWPFTGSGWYVSQGYNGSSHYNGGSSYQYYYSFDLARSDGATAGQSVLSPVSGTVRWTEVGSGGVSIDLGNGYAVAFFHVTMDPSITAGTRVSQGQYMGYVSGPGGPGYAQFPHIHLSAWRTTDGGNWSRTAVPFTGVMSIAGRSFPDTGGYNQYYGTRI